MSDEQHLTFSLPSLRPPVSLIGEVSDRTSAFLRACGLPETQKFLVSRAQECGCKITDLTDLTFVSAPLSDPSLSPCALGAEPTNPNPT
jgi:hypothetical protein